MGLGEMRGGMIMFLTVYLNSVYTRSWSQGTLKNRGTKLLVLHAKGGKNPL